MPQKFKVGDYARVGGRSHRHLVAAYPWLKRGQLLKVIGVAGRTKGGHIEYSFASRRGQPGPRLASYDLRHVYDRERAPGGGRRFLGNKTC